MKLQFNQSCWEESECNIVRSDGCHVKCIFFMFGVLVSYIKCENTRSVSNGWFVCVTHKLSFLLCAKCLHESFSVYSYFEFQNLNQIDTFTIITCIFFFFLLSPYFASCRIIKRSVFISNCKFLNERV